MGKWIAMTLAAVVGSATAILAAPQDREAGAPVVDAFVSRCLGKPNDIVAIIAQNNADKTLTPTGVPSEFVDRKINPVAAWTLEIENRRFELIYLRRPEFKNSGIQCMLRSSHNDDNIFPYLDPLNRAIKPMGLKGRKIDLPHYYLTRGKVPDGRPTEVRLMTRFSLPKWNDRYLTLWALYA